MEYIGEMPQFDDRFLRCTECSNNFVFKSGEQRFYWSKGLSDPKRCGACRKRRKLTLAVEVHSYEY